MQAPGRSLPPIRAYKCATASPGSSLVCLSPARRQGRKLVFVVTEDWFFASHFLPMARAARELGLEVAVVTRVRDHRAAIEATGAQVIPLEAERRSLNPMAAGYAAGRLAAILKAERPDIVHCIALRAILVGGFAALMAGIPRPGLRPDRPRLPRRPHRTSSGAAPAIAVRLLVRGLETRADPLPVREPGRSGAPRPRPGRRRARRRSSAAPASMPSALRPRPLPPQPPLKVAVVARMLWSKGIDVAVEAVQRARGAGSGGRAVALRRARPVEPEGHAGGDAAGLERRAGHRPGTAAREDVAGVWRDHHVCCLPSRGGEGLPRTLLEGAACGRAIVTTDVPGCRAPRARRHRGASSCRRTMPRRSPSAFARSPPTRASSPAWAGPPAPACSTASPSAT